MELQQIAALVVFLAVYALSATSWVHRAVTALVGAVAVGALLGLPALVGTLVPEVVLVTAGLMVLSGYVKRAGIASWLVLNAAKAGRGRPNRILFLTGLITYAVGAFLGPVAAVALVVPVAVLLAIELDVSPLPFVVTLSWTSLLGGATTLTAQPGNLWVGASLGIDGASWVLSMAPFTLAALVATLITASVVFGKQLRVTNERRARVLEYDESQSLGNRPLLVKTLSILALVVLGLVSSPWMGLSPSIVAVGGAVLLRLWDTPRSAERFLGEGEGATLLFFGGLMTVVGALTASGLPQAWATSLPANPLFALLTSALLGTVLDHGAVAGALVPFLKVWSGNPLWPFVILGTSLGAGVTVLGSASGALALSMAGQGPRKQGWRDFSRFGLLFAVVNLAVVSGLTWLWMS